MGLLGRFVFGALREALYLELLGRLVFGALREALYLGLLGRFVFEALREALYLRLLGRFVFGRRPFGALGSFGLFLGASPLAPCSDVRQSWVHMEEDTLELLPLNPF